MIGYRQRKKKTLKAETKGFTLIEVLVSVVLFSAIMLSATELFKLSIDSQRAAIAVQNVQESLKYFLEMTAKEVRMAQAHEGLCPEIGGNKIFSINHSGDLLFKNYYDECVSYSLEEDSQGVSRFKVSRLNTKSGELVSGYISPSKINIENLSFSLNDDYNNQRSVVTINIKAIALGDKSGESSMVLQTSVSSRYYKDF